MTLSWTTTIKWVLYSVVAAPYLFEWAVHGLDYRRIEEVFFNEPLQVMEDFSHSDAEWRCFVYGHDDRGTRIMVVFTTRNDRIRVISARTMTPKEKRYGEM